MDCRGGTEKWEITGRRISGSSRWSVHRFLSITWPEPKPGSDWGHLGSDQRYDELTSGRGSSLPKTLNASRRTAPLRVVNAVGSSHTVSVIGATAISYLVKIENNQTAGESNVTGIRIGRISGPILQPRAQSPGPPSLRVWQSLLDMRFGIL